MTKDELEQRVAIKSNQLYKLEAIIRRLEDQLTGDMKLRHCVRYKDGRYPYIPLNPESFMRQLDQATRALGKGDNHYTYPSFVDVGCGIGTKLLIAEQCYLAVYGIEVVERYAAIAKELTRLGKRIIVGDALEQDYRPYDIIYFYRPFSDEKLQGQLEERIVETAHPGAVILANLKNGGDARWQAANKSLEHIADSVVYRKVA